MSQKIDLTAIDARIKQHLPEAKLEEGVKYARWAVVEGIIPQASIDTLKQALECERYFEGVVIGKQLTIFLFAPNFD